MPLELNEAPEIIIGALNYTTTRRDCGTFWSIICWPFSCGTTLAERDNNSNYDGCCYPKAISTQSEQSLERLLTELNKLIVHHGERYSQKNLDAAIKNQYRQTKELVKNILTNELNENSSYKTALQAAYQELKSRYKPEVRLPFFKSKKTPDVETSLKVFGKKAKKALEKDVKDLSKAVNAAAKEMSRAESEELPILNRAK